MKFLCTVQDAFEIAGRGCVLTPGISKTTPSDIKIKTHDQILLRRPDGSVLRTHIEGVAMLDRRDRSWCAPILLPSEFGKADVPIGTEIWLDDSAAPEAR